MSFSTGDRCRLSQFRSKLTQLMEEPTRFDLLIFSVGGRQWVLRFATLGIGSSLGGAQTQLGPSCGIPSHAKIKTKSKGLNVECIVTTLPLGNAKCICITLELKNTKNMHTLAQVFYSSKCIFPTEKHFINPCQTT